MSEQPTITVNFLPFGEALTEQTIKKGGTVEDLINHAGLPKQLMSDGFVIKVNGSPASRSTVLVQGQTITLQPGKVEAA